LLIRQKSTINKLPESDIVPTQALPLPNAAGDHSVPQPKAGGDHNVPQHQKATFEVAKRFMEAIVFTKTPWPIISDEKYSMVAETWQLAIEAQDRQRGLAGAPVGTHHPCVNCTVVHLLKLFRKPEKSYVITLCSAPQLDL